MWKFAGSCKKISTWKGWHWWRPNFLTICDKGFFYEITEYFKIPEGHLWGVSDMQR
jgi:hypothetical protein